MPTIEWSLPGAFGAVTAPTLGLATAGADVVPLSAAGKVVEHSLQELLRTRGARASRRQEERAT